MNTNSKCLFLIGFGAWRCQRTMQLLTLPAQSECSVCAPGKCPTEAYPLNPYTCFWITNTNCPGSKKEKKQYWLSVYATKFSSINIPTRVPGNSAIQGAQLRKNSFFPPRRQRAWELKRFVRGHQALTLPDSNKWIFCSRLYYPWQ